MMSKEVEFKKVVIEFSFWEAQIKNLSSLNLLDGNIFSEDTVCTLLNIIFGYQLKNVNEQNNNYPAIDLADNYNRTAVQVTSTKTKKKIQSTLDKFFEHELQQEFDEIFIFILGKKQKSYTNLKIVRDFEFDAKKNILDFKDLLDIIRYLPKKKIEYIANFLQKERLTDSNRKTKSNAVKIKQNLALKKRLKKDLLLKLEKSSLRKAMYVPYIKFKYSKVIIRSVNDEKFPERGFTDGEIDSWFVSEFWRFYDNGLELVSLGGTVIFDENGNWDIPNWEANNTVYPANISIKSCNTFLRIPYEYIVSYDMEPDNYYGYPTIYVQYAKEGKPYEEIVYGKMGYYNEDAPSESKLTHYFDKNKRKKLANDV